MTFGRGSPSRNPNINCRLTALFNPSCGGIRLTCRMPAPKAKTLAGVTQTGGNPRDRHQQGLFYRAALRYILQS